MTYDLRLCDVTSSETPNIKDLALTHSVKVSPLDLASSDDSMRMAVMSPFRACCHIMWRCVSAMISHSFATSTCQQMVRSAECYRSGLKGL